MRIEFDDNLITGNEMIDTQHKELFDMLEEEDGPSEAFVKQVESNVVNWLILHIQGFDRSVAEYRFMADNADRI